MQVRNMEVEKIDWQKSKSEVFWGEVAPCDHVIQIYENDEVFLNALELFVIDGVKANQSTIVIATSSHLTDINYRILQNGFDPQQLVLDGLLVPMNAEETLQKFMINGWPDEDLFNETISQVINNSLKKNQKVRAFGEMVAILWAQGHNGATVQLENLWNKFCENQSFTLFCAYPKSGFTQDLSSSFQHIYCSHKKMISGIHGSKTDIYYKSTSDTANT
jgi:hypothetical protein